MNFILNLIAGSIPLVFVMLPWIYLIPKERRWSKSLCAEGTPSAQPVRQIESVVLCVFALIPILKLVTGGIGWNITPLPNFLIRDRAILCGIMAFMSLGWLILGLRKSTSIAAGGMIVSLLIGAAIVTSTNALSYERYESEIRQIPLPFEVSIHQEIGDVEVLINGVKMGTAPLKTTLETIEANRDSWKPISEENHKDSKNLSSSTYLPGKLLKIDSARAVNIGDHDLDSKVDLYFQFERKGQPLMVSGNIGYSHGSRMFGQIQPVRIPFNVMTESWDRDLKTFLMKAQLSDFHVDDDWFNAAETYGEIVHSVIQNAMTTEDGYQQVLNDWARFRYRLDRVGDADSAWQTFEQIERQADDQGRYITDSIEGDAVEWLTDHLDASRLIATASQRLKDLLRTGSITYGWSWHTRNGKQHFATSPYNDASSLKPRDFVLAHAVLALDRKWDSQPHTKDNPTEQEIVPDLLRISYQQPQARHMAIALGGSVLNEFLRREQQNVHGYAPSNDFGKNDYVEGEPILRAFWEPLNASGPAGARFRQQHAYHARELAERFLAKEHSLTSLPNWTSFLFLEVEGREPLAKDLWKSFQNKVDADQGVRHWALAVKWDYLVKMNPLPPAAEFVNAFPVTANDFGDIVSPENVLWKMPPELRLAVVRGCIRSTEKSQSTLKPKSGPYVAFDQIQSQLISSLLRIPLESAVDEAMRYLDPAHPRFNEVNGQLKNMGNYGELSPQIIRRLVASSNPEHRQWVIPQIQKHPNKDNRESLERLRKDEVQTVRESAEKVAAELNEIQQKPLPRLE